jgi:hypothetical protein
MRLFLCVCLVALVAPSVSSSAPLLVTSTSGHLIFEVLEGHGATSNQEFGIGTPATDSDPSDRMIVFTIHLVDEQVGSVTPASIVDMGFFPAGTALDFYNLSDFSGLQWAFSEHLGSTPSAADLEVFTDRNHSLGFGGSAVEINGVDNWILHLDDAASGDDDDNEMVIRVRVGAPVPEPSIVALVVIGGGLALRRRATAGSRRSSPDR